MTEQTQSEAKRMQYLEEQLAFMEHASEARDREMLEQSRELQRLSRAVKLLGEQLRKLQESQDDQGDLPHEKPPHY